MKKKQLKRLIKHSKSLSDEKHFLKSNLKSIRQSVISDIESPQHAVDSIVDLGEQYQSVYNQSFARKGFDRNIFDELLDSSHIGLSNNNTALPVNMRNQWVLTNGPLTLIDKDTVISLVANLLIVFR